MSGPKPGRPADDEGRRRAARTWLASLPPGAAARLRAAAGVDGAAADPTAALIELASTPAGAERILTAQPRDRRDALRLLLAVPPQTPESELEFASRGRFGWGRTRCREAVAGLVEAGLVARATGFDAPISPFPALAVGLAPTLRIWLADGSTDASVEVAAARRLALLVAWIHAEPVLRTADRRLAIRWQDRYARLFELFDASEPLLIACFELLARTGALGHDPADPRGQTWNVTERASEVLASAPEDLALALAAGLDTRGPGTTLGALHVLTAAAATGTPALELGALRERGLEWVRTEAKPHLPYFEEQFAPFATSHAVRRLRSAGLVTTERAGDGLLVRRVAAAPVRRPFRCTVLPTFEVLVAEDADPAATAELGRLADLVGVDRVARFTLTKQGVARAAKGREGAAGAIAALEAAAEHGLPPNVKATLQGWARLAVPLRSWHGTVFLTASDAQRSLLARYGPGAVELSKDVWLVAPAEVESLREEAVEEGFPLPPTANMTAAERSSGPRREHPTVEELARAPKASLARWSEAPRVSRRSGAAANPPQGAGPIGRAGAARAGSPPSKSPPAKGLSGDEIRRRFPRVWKVAERDPVLVHLVGMLDPDLLEEVELHVRGERATVDALVAGAVQGRTTEPLDLSDEEAAFLADDGDEDETEGNDDEIVRLLPPLPARGRSGAPPPLLSTTWSTPSPGVLGDLLEAAAESETPIELVYVNVQGKRSERRVIPHEVVHVGRQAFLEATSEADGSTGRYDLARIAAIRAAAPRRR